MRRHVSWAVALCTLTAVGALAQTAVVVGASIPLSDAPSIGFPVITVAAVIGAVVGAAIVIRHSRHRIGWLFCVGQAGAAVGLAAQTVGWAVFQHGLDWPASVGIGAYLLGGVFGAPYALALLALLLLLVPNGALLSRRWRPIPMLVAGSYALYLVGLLLATPALVASPAGALDVGPVVTGVLNAGRLGVALGVVAGFVAMVVRFRRARAEERRQLRWVAVAVAVLVVGIVSGPIDVATRGYVNVDAQAWYTTIVFLGYLAVPVTTGYAVLRHRLFNVDVIIGSTIRLAVLATFITAGYVAIVVAVSEVVGSRVGADAWPSLFALVVVALAFQPARRHARSLADRVVYGRRAAPYDALAEFSRQLGNSASPQQLLPRVAQAIATGVGVIRADVVLSLADVGEQIVSWPAGAKAPFNGPTVELPVGNRDELLGRIRLFLEPGRALSRPERRLLAEFAAQTGVAFRNARLVAELEERAKTLVGYTDELASSRRRLITAGDAERERVAAQIRGAVTGELEPLPSRLEQVERDLLADPAGAAAVLDELRVLTTGVLEALRVITGGIFPPLLIRHGVGAALQEHVGSTDGRVTLAMGVGSDGRFPAHVEAAVYFFCVQTVRDLDGPAHLVLAADARELSVSLQGRTRNGRPTSDPVQQRVLDRIEAVGGRVSRTRSADGAHHLHAVLPLDTVTESATAAPVPALEGS